ncbi:hypothetical protein [Modestobacter roseus]|uniref:Uncharacterized protein n=1 Tax=Modestobacter roseus TaxID=1181884 RepID=A0A562ISM6_9ACTN|nr:hypothetical protein [Modestobacter roseus]MQA36126.1 hypothetical protein [Modestobacter roseus]TWH74011.1 hypothetical protein JD78_02543 [Modestobacter roseus]
MAGRISSLGTAPAVVSTPVAEKVGRFRRKMVPRAFTYLEWTIDGVPLREVVAWPDGSVAREVTPVGNGAALPEYEVDYLRAVLGEPVSREWAVMPDGRVPLLVCEVDFDLDCRALTAELVRSDDRVEWRDIAWQVTYEPLDLTEQELPVMTLAFDRQQYDDVVRPLLAAAPEG